jgi:hypothetical protein
VKIIHKNQRFKPFHNTTTAFARAYARHARAAMRMRLRAITRERAALWRCIVVVFSICLKRKEKIMDIFTTKSTTGHKAALWKSTVAVRYDRKSLKTLQKGGF